eukprot:TRINITY_DN3748_c0_g1_i1.p1 TRINITY_DN3748_c0_g1~~TRINITY_DN3748_c0_g1_i1.p1  ORF type:complete len:579 (+),score=185.09 TRINITY_DN3748_c0_g1_i1:191-1927(+)
MTDSENGFMQPNPALFDLEERRRKKSSLAHELGEGSSCRICLGKCPGFQLHYWRKVCSNCRCGKAEHDVRDSEIDPGCYFVGKIFDRPLRSLKEELEFCYGRFSPSEELKRSSRTNANDSGNESIKTDDDEDEEGKQRRLKSKGNHAGSSSSPGPVAEQQNKKVLMDWVPPNVSRALVTKYLKSVPYVPIAGSSGALQRRQQLQKQFPVHDIEPDKCHNLTASEIDSMINYLSHVKENNIGQGLVLEIPEEEYDEEEEEEEDYPLPPPPLEGLHISQMPPDELPPPPPSFLLEEDDEEEKQNGGDPSSLLPSSRIADDIRKFSSLPPRKNAAVPTNSPPPPPPSTGGVLETSSSSHSKSPSKDAAALTIPSGLSPVIKGSCDGCKKDFLPGDVVIRAERSTEGQLWHPSCFKCSVCKELLVDLLYYYDSGKLYCGRDFSVIVSKIPRCGACDELIFASEYTGAEDKVFHLRHFCCYECDRPLAGHKYISVDSQPHCFICYQAKHGKVCKTCNEYINPGDQRLSLDNDHWHANEDCFCCGVCGKSLVGAKMTRKDGYILCSSTCKVKLLESMVKRGVVV